MGRGYLVDDSVEKYLINLHSLDLPFVTGLLIGQFGVQKDYVVLAAPTPQKEKEAKSSVSNSSTAACSLNDMDIHWVSEHAKQVSQMLPGGLSVLGVFLIHLPELSTEAQNTLRRLIFAVEKVLSKGRLWEITEEDVPERVMLQICSKTLKAVCRTFNVMDPKSVAKPAEWKYQSGVSRSWQALQCCVELDLEFSVSEMSSGNAEKCTREALQRWAKQIKSCLCLINGKRLADNFDVMAGLKKNAKANQPDLRAQIIIPAVGSQAGQRSTASVQACSGVLTVKGVVHCRAYLYTHKPRVWQAVEAIKRDVMNTVQCRTEMLFEDLLMNDGAVRSQQPLPLRVFAQLPGTAFCVCDYIFPDESTADVKERFKEMLDLDIPEDSIDTSQEAHVEMQSSSNSEEYMDSVKTDFPAKATEQQKSLRLYLGAAMAAGVALLATAVSLIYFSD